jgi:putative DNA methylase
MSFRRKLIEVALPLEAINKAAAREKSIRHGHPSTLHLWWARRPLAAARAVIFAQLVDDPSSWPELWPTEDAQDKERQRLFRVIETMVHWPKSDDAPAVREVELALAQARAEILECWQRTCEDNRNHPRAKDLFDPLRLPGFHDPFAGGGALPLEAQRLGLEAYASDLNPVAVLINKAMIEIPPKFSGRPPVHPKTRLENALLAHEWKGAQGLAEDVRYYGQWMRDEAEKRIGHLYPKVEVTAEMTERRPDLKAYAGQKLTVIAWLWARTVKSPNPAFANVNVPLASTFMLSTKEGKEAYVQPVVSSEGYQFEVRTGTPEDVDATKRGLSAGKWNAFRCIMSDVPVTYDYIRNEGTAGRLGTRLMAIVAEGNRERVYLSPTKEVEAAALQAVPDWSPELEINYHPRDIKTQIYGLTRYRDLFTSRQLVALDTLCDLVHEVHERTRLDALAAGMPEGGRPLHGNGSGAIAYADAVSTYLAFAISKVANIGSSIATWMSDRGAFRETFARQAIPMTWDFAEANPFADAGGSLGAALEKGSLVIGALPSRNQSVALQADAQSQTVSVDRVVSTDPPYFDNIGYADLSDFFYVWLRRALQSVFPDLFATVAVPKSQELVATPYRHGSKEKAETFFLNGMTEAMHRLAESAHPAFPVTIYYAFKQSESQNEEGVASTGWETFLDAVIRAGLSISGTWPMRTEGAGRIMAKGNNALASSIILVCRPRVTDAPTATRREFVTALNVELPGALAHLQRGNIAPVDLAQAAIGPGMAIYTRYSKVLDAAGKPLSVRDALALINRTLDEALAAHEGGFDAGTHWALKWFDEVGFNDGDYGRAETLSKAKNTSVNGMVEAGILASKGGKVRLLRPTELDPDWDPTKDARLTAWESVHHLVRVLETGGEDAAADLVRRLGSMAQSARELAYRLYSVCERKKRAADALSYNALVQSWPEIVRRAEEGRIPTQTQQEIP